MVFGEAKIEDLGAQAQQSAAQQFASAAPDGPSIEASGPRAGWEFCQNFGKMLLVFGCIGAELCE